jgi:hypothetical protein
VKILVCGADDIDLYFRFMFLSICFIRFVFFIISYRMVLLFCGVHFIINDLVYFID